MKSHATVLAADAEYGNTRVAVRNAPELRDFEVPVPDTGLSEEGHRHGASRPREDSADSGPRSKPQHVRGLAWRFVELGQWGRQRHTCRERLQHRDLCRAAQRDFSLGPTHIAHTDDPRSTVLSVGATRFE